MDIFLLGFVVVGLVWFVFCFLGFFLFSDKIKNPLYLIPFGWDYRGMNGDVLQPERNLNFFFIVFLSSF